MNLLAKSFLLVSLVFVTDQVLATSLDQKQQNQRQRIKQGVVSGELTKKETKRLVKGQKQLNRMERRAKADGVVTRKERARLHKKANRESAKIAKNKHDRQKRDKARH